MTINSLLKRCDSGFDNVIVADSTSGHTYEYKSVKDVQTEAGSNQVISWEVGLAEEMGRGFIIRRWVLYITIRKKVILWKSLYLTFCFW